MTPTILVRNPGGREKKGKKSETKVHMIKSGRRIIFNCVLYPIHDVRRTSSKHNVEK